VHAILKAVHAILKMCTLDINFLFWARTVLKVPELDRTGWTAKSS